MTASNRRMIFSWRRFASDWSVQIAVLRQITKAWINACSSPRAASALAMTPGGSYRKVARLGGSSMPSEDEAFPWQPTGNASGELSSKDARRLRPGHADRHGPLQDPCEAPPRSADPARSGRPVLRLQECHRRGSPWVTQRTPPLGSLGQLCCDVLESWPKLYSRSELRAEPKGPAAYARATDPVSAAAALVLYRMHTCERLCASSASAG